MKTVKCLEPHENIERGMIALYKEFGPVETRRFMTFTHPTRREESVKRHRRWQATLNRKDVLDDMRAAYTGARKK